MNNTNSIIELSNVEVYEHCLLDIKTGETKYYKDKKKIPYFTGLYFKDNQTFFGLYPTINGPVMYYGKKEYPLTRDLHINLKKAGKWREFCIKEYNIRIKYRTSPYIGFDVWSEEEDVDLFYQIAENYKNAKYYEKFTKNNYS